jgi:hypothetical protein
LQPRSHGEHYVRFRPKRVPARQDLAERVALIEDALAAAIGDHRRTQKLGQRAHLAGRFERAAANKDHRALGLRQQAGRARDGIFVERRIRLGRQGRHQFDFGFRGEEIGRQFDPDRPRPAGLQSAERLRHQPRAVLWLLHALRRLGELTQDPQLIRNLVQQSVTFADGAARNLTDQREHPCAGRIGGDERSRAVEKARPRHHRINGRPAGRERSAECHIGGALLVPRMHDRERIADVEHGIEQMIALYARQAIDRRHAVAQNRSDDSVASAHQRHSCSFRID